MSCAPPPSLFRPSVGLAQLPRGFSLKDEGMVTPSDVFDANREADVAMAEFIRVRHGESPLFRATHETVMLSHVARRATQRAGWSARFNVRVSV
jgi:hypothetical protein